MVHKLAPMILLLTSSIAGAEIDVRGSWQGNLDCGGYATATSFLTFDENLTTGEVTPLPAACGTVTLLGAPVAQLESCDATGESGQVTGTSFSLPASGYATSDQTLENPVYFGIANCVVKRIVVTSQHNGTISDDGAGTATGIVGSLTNGSVQMYNSGGALCFSFLGPFTFCTYEMLRNDVPAGSNVSVQPNERVSVTFDSVSLAGTAGVTPLNDPAAEIPANFQLLGGVLPIFYDISTTASVSGPITICYAYDDVNDDGIVDGTQLAETNLQLLHEEEEVFVDRTASLDTVGNVICAETTSLSQLVPGAPTTGVPPPPPGNPDDVPVSGIKVLLKRDTTGVEKGAFLTRDQDAITPPAAGGPDDPRSVGATFEVISAAEGVATFPLPAAGWLVTDSGVFKFNGALVGGPVKRAVIKPGKSIVVKTTATGVPLSGAQGTVSARFTTGDLRHCARFGPTTIVKDEANRFSAKGALAAALLDCSDAALGISSPSGAFVE
jgi:hypothetical protein